LIIFNASFSYQHVTLAYGPKTADFCGSSSVTINLLQQLFWLAPLLDYHCKYTFNWAYTSSYGKRTELTRLASFSRELRAVLRSLSLIGQLFWADDLFQTSYWWTSLALLVSTPPHKFAAAHVKIMNHTSGKAAISRRINSWKCRVTSGFKKSLKAYG
jgi:hypothetical protein